MKKKIKINDTRGNEHLIDPELVEMFSAGRCPLNRQCVEIVENGEIIFADCSLYDFTEMLSLSCA